MSSELRRLVPPIGENPLPQMPFALTYQPPPVTVGGHGHDGEGVVKEDAAVTLLLAAVRLTRPSDHSECLAGNHPHRKYFRHFVVVATVRICFPMEERISLGSRGF